MVASTSERTAAPTSCSSLPMTDQPINNTEEKVEVIVQVGAAVGIFHTRRRLYLSSQQETTNIRPARNHASVHVSCAQESGDVH